MHDRFFDLGGSSLQAVRFISRLSDELGDTIPIVALFDAPTVAQLVEVLRNEFGKAMARRFGAKSQPVRESAPARQSASRLEDELAPASSLCEVAIIGMAGRFPGAPDLDTFWTNLRDGRECQQPVTASDLEASGLDPTQLDDDHYVATSFTLDDADGFDAAFFGFTPREAELMDPQQRVFLETAYAALENAGYDHARYAGRIGVFGGVGRNPYLLENIARHPQYADRLVDHALQVGNERDFPATHVAYRLNLRGPALNVQTACSTSGVALHLACQSLRSGDSDVVIVGGCKILNPPHAGYTYVDGDALATDGHVRAFDARASGMVRGSGCGMLVVKLLHHALRDGDHIWGVIKATAVNNDGGGKVGFAAPSVQGQSEVITRALELSGVNAEDISYVETHGTGTIIGDPIEVAGFTRAYRRFTDARGFCAIGSVKTNIGHLDAGAMAAGVIKTLLAFDHECIPPSLNFETPNPEIDFETSPFRVAERPLPWVRGRIPRRAGVSSFGLGGTNAHVILEEPPAPEPPAPGRDHQLLLFSAKTGPALDAMRHRLATHLGSSDRSLADAAYTLAVGRHRHGFRAAVVARDAPDAARALADAARVDTREDGTEGTAVAFMFPGGGEQYVEMAAGLYRREAAFRDALDRCATAAETELDVDLRTLIYPTGNQPHLLERARYALPTLFAVEYAVHALLTEWGITPSALIGHSMGEYTAACVAGVLTLEQALAVVSCRGRLFETLPQGGMLGVPLAEADVVARMSSDLSLAAVNLPDQCVVSGPTAAIESMRARLIAEEVEATRIHIDVAAHSTLLGPILDEFAEFVGGLELQPPEIPIISNVIGDWADPDDIRTTDYWVAHLRQTVRFSDGLATALQDRSLAFLEVGPGRALSSFARHHPARKSQAVVSTLRHPKVEADDLAFLLQSLGQLWTAGVDLDHDALYRDQPRRRVPLPSYPFERTRYYLSRPSTVLSAEEAGATGSTAQADPAPRAPAAVPEMATRRERIDYELKTIISELSGVPVTKIDSGATFLELGFDSLFLTQAIVALRKKFGVATTVRQLLEKTPSVGALTGFLDAELPGDDVPTSKPESSRSPGTDARGQLPRGAAGGTDSPWQPVGSGGDGQLTDEQHRHVTELVKAVCRRAPRSKAATQEHREHFADPRTVQGFKLRWKEMVFPLVSEKTLGSRLWDIDGNEYIDLVNGYGVTLLGHNPEFIRRAIRAQLERGVEIGPQNYLAGQVAQLVCELTGMDRAAFCNTGSEAVLAAIRLARTVKAKPRIATFAGHYHGIFDEVLVQGVTRGDSRRTVPIAPGIPPWNVENTLVLDYGNPESLDLIRKHADELALVLVEPVRSRNPAFQPVEFVRELRRVTEEHDIALLFDEMVTGFRAHPGGMQALWNIRADLATYGKVAGGGFPIGIVTGKAEYMDALDGGMWSFGDESVPEADMTWFAGTFVRHPVAMASTHAMLTHLKQSGPGLQETLNRKVAAFAREMNLYFQATGTPIWIEQFASFIVLKFTSFQEYAPLLFYHLHNRGIFTYEGRPAFFTTAHTDEDFAKIRRALCESVQALQQVRLLPGAPPETEERIPMSEGQQEIWLAARLGHDASCAYNLASTLRLRGELHVDNVRDAVRMLAQRHQALRCVPNDDGRTQRVLPAFGEDIPLIDVSDDVHQVDETRRAEVTTEFDFETGPLFRAKILKVGPHDHLVILTAHHVIADGWSCGVMCRDLGILYGSLCDGKSPELEAVMSYGEYIAREASNARQADRKAAEDYWVSQYEGAPIPVLDLPTDRPRPPVKTFRADRVNLTLDAEFVDGLRELAKRQGATLFSVVLATFHALLNRLSGQPDAVVGFSVAGQADVEERALVGHCVQFLPLRLSLAPEATLSDHIKNVRGRLFDAVEHKSFAFGTLVQRLRIPRDPSRVPLMSVAFNLDPHSRGVSFHDLECTAGSIPRRYENFDLFFNLVEGDDHLDVQCTFNLDLFDHDTVRERLEQYRSLLAEVTADPGRTPHELPLVTAAQRERQVVDWNRTAAPYPADARLDELVSAQASRQPDAQALLALDRSLSYRELETDANRLAHALIARGVGPGQRVGVRLPRTSDLLVALLGVLKAGAAYVPMDPALPPARVAHLTTDSGAALVLSDLASLDLSAQSCKTPPSRAGAGDVAYVAYTSGSTGDPKGVMVPHRALVAYLSWAVEHYRMADGRGAPVHSSLGFDLTVTALWGPLLAGRAVHLLADDDDIEALGRALTDPGGYSVVKMTPSHLDLLAAQLSPAAAARAMGTLVVGGEALRAEQLAFFREHAPHMRIINEYGPTEATVGCCIYEVGDHDRSGPVPIGRPAPNARLYILDEWLQPVSIGVTGELFIGGPQVALGYLNQPELTAEHFIESPFVTGDRLYRTGDLARFRATGDIDFLGRRDRQIKVRGHRIEPGEVESVLQRASEVERAVVLADDEALHAFAVPSQPDEGGWKQRWDALYLAGAESVADRDDAQLDDLVILRQLSDQEGYDAEVREGLDATFARLVELPLDRVLAIGCGTGSVLLRLAPHCGHINGTDYAAGGIQEVERLLRTPRYAPLSNVTVELRRAGDFSGIRRGTYGAVILNSVCQYFPSADYLRQVLAGAVSTIDPDDGVVFIGDVQSHTLLDAHHAFDQLQRSPADTSAAELRRLVERRIRTESELVVDPGFFYELQRALPGIGRIELRLRRGHIQNETTRFHYDVWLHAGPTPAPTPVTWRPWSRETDVRQLLETREDVVCLAGVVNWRNASHILAADLIRTTDQTAQEIRASLEDKGVDPETLWTLGETHGYAVDLRWSDDAPRGSFDAVFVRRNVEGVFVPPRSMAPTARTLTNAPAHTSARRDLAERLRTYARQQLPDYMVPASFHVVSSIPLTSNGKVDVEALRARRTNAAALPHEVFRAPKTDTERTIAAVWREVLDLDRVGRDRDFFELGGHSLSGVQVIVRVREELELPTLSLSSLFECPTIATLATKVESMRYVRETPNIDESEREELQW